MPDSGLWGLVMGRMVFRLAVAITVSCAVWAGPAVAAGSNQFDRDGLEELIKREIQDEMSANGIEGLLSSPTVGGDVVIARDSDKILTFGGNIEVKDTRANLVAGAAGNLRIEASIIGKVVAAAGTITIQNTTIEKDMALAAGEIDLSAHVNGDLRIFGGQIRVAPATVVNGDAQIKGGNITIAGIVNGDLEAMGERVALSGTVNGDATILAEAIDLAPGTTIQGDLVYASSDAFTLPEGVTVNGDVRRRDGGSGEVPEDFRISISELFGGGLTGWFLGLLTLGVCGAAALALAPVVMTSAGQIVAKEPLPSLGVGAAVLIGVPVAAGLLAVTVIGIPLAALLIAASIIALGLGLITACLWGSDRIRHILKQDRVEKNLARRMGWVVLAFVLFVAIGGIPVIGGIAQILAVVAGTGAVVLAAWARRGISAAG